MKTFIFIVVLILIGISYFCLIKKESSKKTPSKPKDKRVESIKRAQKNLHPHFNKGVDRGANGRFTKKS